MTAPVGDLLFVSRRAVSPAKVVQTMQTLLKRGGTTPVSGGVIAQSQLMRVPISAAKIAETVRTLLKSYLMRSHAVGLAKVVQTARALLPRGDTAIISGGVIAESQLMRAPVGGAEAAQTMPALLKRYLMRAPIDSAKVAGTARALLIRELMCNPAARTQTIVQIASDAMLFGKSDLSTARTADPSAFYLRIHIFFIPKLLFPPLFTTTFFDRPLR